MTDPLSVCASVLAIIAAAEGTIQGLRKVKGYWNAPAVIDDIVTGVNDLRSTLRDVEAVVKRSQSPIYSESLAEPVRRASSTIDSINALLFSKPFHLTRLGNKNHSRAIWIRYRNEINGFLESLKLVRFDLMLKLGIINLSATIEIQDSVNISIGIQNTVSEQLSVIINREEQVAKVPNRALLEKASALRNDVPGQSAFRTPAGFIEDATADARMQTSNSDISLQQPSTPTESSRSQRGRRCAPWCNCKCHTRRSVKTPWVLETLIGRIDVSYTGTRPECNEQKCSRTSTAPACTITHQLPRYLMSRYIHLSMQHTPQDGPAFALRLPRVTPWSHLLWSYALAGDLQAMQKMFSQGKASPHDINPHGDNVLSYTPAHKDYRIPQFLIQQGADPNLPNESGRVASKFLWDSSFSGRFGDEGISIVTSLLEDSDYTETRGFSTLHKMVLGILDYDLEMALEDSTASVNNGDARGRTPLHWATIRDDLGSVQALLAAGGNPNTIDDEGNSSLSYVRGAAVCKALLHAGAWINTRNTYYQRTALHNHCNDWGEIDVIDLLIWAGMDVDVRNFDNETPLLNCVFWHLTAVANRLIELGADVNIRNTSSRENSLHFAVLFDHPEIIPVLMAKNVDYRPVNIRGRNIAHMAASSASTTTVRVLAQSNLVGLDFAAKDVDGKTPADLLKEREIFAEKEVGIHEAFDAFSKSVMALDLGMNQV